MNRFEFEDTLRELKAQFFSSKYSTVEHFAQYSGLWPSEFDPIRLLFWNNEKRAFLQKKLQKDTALGETYKMNLTDRLALIAQVQDLIAAEISTMKGLDAKEIKSLVDTLNKLSEMQDKTISILKVDAIKDDEFNKNKSSVLDELRRIKPEKTTTSNKRRSI